MKTTALLLSSFAAASMALSAAANRPEIFQLGDANTLVRVTDGGKYLTLPVQESMPDQKIDILVNGKVEQTIFVRLADSNVDYSVPLLLTPYTDKGEVMLNVDCTVDRTHSRQAADFVCWDMMEITDEFDTANTEKYRPVFHHTPLYGWMNDPNGMFFKDGVWHLYYQYNPYGSKWQNMNWGHSSSTDLIHWQHQPLAIEPDGLGTVFSGSSVVDYANSAGLGEGAVVALYTGAGKSQVQNMAYSLDNGLTFAKYNGNPVIPNRDEARDPNMFWHEPSQQWVLILAHPLEKEMLIYNSPNLIDWTLQSSFGKGYGSQEGVWECPDLFELPVSGSDLTKWVLVCNINPGAPMGGSGTQYFIGDFDGKTFTPDDGPEVAKWMDYGKDHYATVSWSNGPDNRRTVIGWMSNWQYANEVPTRQFRSANTLPRDLSLFRDDDGSIYLASTPVAELEALRNGKTSYSHINVTPKPVGFDIPELAEIVVDYDARKSSFLNIALSNENGEEVLMSLDINSQQFSVDRTRSGLCDFSSHFPSKTIAPTHRKAAKGTLRIFIDKSSIEVFDGEGRFVLTNLVFPTAPYSRISFQALGANARLDRLSIYPLAL